MSDRNRAAQHTAVRPTWRCAACGEPWPCGPGRADLRNGRNRVQIAMLMWAVLEKAAADLPGMPAAEMFRRFIGWTKDGPGRVHLEGKSEENRK